MRSGEEEGSKRITTEERERGKYDVANYDWVKTK